MMNAPAIIAQLRRGRLDLSADNANPVAVERRRHPRTVEMQEAYIAEHDAAEYQRRFNVARAVHIDDALDTMKKWRSTDAYKKYELERLSRNGRVAA